MMNNTNGTAPYREFSSMCFLFIPSIIVSVLGIPGTLITMRFYGKQVKKSKVATSLILTSLAVFDMLTLLLIIPMVGISIHLFYIDGWKQAKIFALFNAISRSPRNCSNFMLLLIGIERLVSVAWPHKLSVIFTKRVGIVCVVIVCSVITPITILPMAVEPELVAIQGTEGKYFVRRLPQININIDLYNIFYQMTIMLYFLVPLGGVFICNITLAILLLKRYRRDRLGRNQSTITPRQARELKTTKLVIVVTIIFIICILPLVVIFPIQTTSGADIPIGGMLLIFPLSMLLESITYSMNAVVYYIGNGTFREEVRNTITTLRKLNNQHQVSPNNTVSTSL
ncbi:neuropeptide Y receptor type 6-like [Argopecten irradians]|uniref:neuropeptide Y receptor type 6-like n=1 Tax=Argopecten irradians TaxID=31199 RepID=UPI00371CFE1B